MIVLQSAGVYWVCCSLLVLDEMDSLDCKSQEVLYTIFEYPSLAKSKLILIGQLHDLHIHDDCSVISAVQCRSEHSYS